jgi:hypothetical protein
MEEEHMTAVYQLRKKDPSRDVVTFLVLNTPPGAVEGWCWILWESHQRQIVVFSGRGWGKTTESEWNKTFLPQIEGVSRKLKKLGSKVSESVVVSYAK